MADSEPMPLLSWFAGLDGLAILHGNSACVLLLMGPTSIADPFKSGSLKLILPVLGAALIATVLAARIFIQYQVGAWENLRLACETAYVDGNYQLAQICATKALEQVPSLARSEINLALSEEDLANTLIAQEEFKQAIDQYRRALSSFQRAQAKASTEFDDGLIRQHTLNCERGLIDSLIAANYFDQAEYQCELALAYAKELKPSKYAIDAQANAANHVAILLALADLKTRQHDFERAEELCRIATGLTDQCAIPEALLSQFKLTYANVLALTGKSKRSQGLLDQTLWLDYVNATVGAIKKNDSEKAERCLKLALQEAKRLGSESDTTALTYEKLAETYIECRQIPRAKEAYSTALKYRLQAGEPSDSISVTSDLSALEKIYMHEDDYQKALMTTEMLMVANSQGNLFSKTEQYAELAEIQSKLGNNGLAVNAIRQTLKLDERPKTHKRRIVRQLLNLADLCKQLNEPELEKAVLDKANNYIVVLQLPEDQLKQRMLNELAGWYERAGRVAEAEKKKREANAIPVSPVKK
jgi:tetratricopeptide (TPR) repeat protein